MNFIELLNIEDFKIKVEQPVNLCPNLLTLSRYEWANFGHLHRRNEAAGVTNSMIDSAVAAFILEVLSIAIIIFVTCFNFIQVVARHGEPADVICAKEPFLMTQATLSSIMSWVII